MDYKKHYNLLLEKHKVTDNTQYGEVHHIIPKCVGGSDNKDNLIRISARSHFIAHQLLVKIYPDVHGLVLAVKFMCTDQFGNRYNNRLYGWVKEKIKVIVSKQMKEFYSDPENLSARVEKAKIKNKSPETKEKRSKSMTEYWANPENRLAQSERIKEYSNNDEVRQRNSQNILKYWTDSENLKEQSIRQTALWKNEEFANKVKTRISNYWANEENRKEHSERMRHACQDPLLRKQRSENAINFAAMKKRYIAESGFTGNTKTIKKLQIIEYFNKVE